MQKPIVQLPTATWPTMHDELVPCVTCNGFSRSVCREFGLFIFPTFPCKMCPCCVPHIPAQPRHDEKDNTDGSIKMQSFIEAVCQLDGAKVCVNERHLSLC